jgi:uncharacterized MAPEG superfamily protein
MTTTLTALLGFAAWFVLLSIVVGLYRGGMMLTAQKPANTFKVDGSDLPGLGQRLTRSRDNCYETLPAFAAIALVAHLSGRSHVTDPLALWVLYARIGQSLSHVASTSVPLVMVRAAFFFTQMLIYAVWCVRLFG